MPRRPAPRTPGPARVLVATDFGEGAARALARVPLLPLPDAADVRVLHVLEWVPSRFAERARREAEERLAPLAAGLERALLAGAQVTTRVARGSVHAEILAEVAAHRSELAVIGRAGTRRAPTDLGTEAERLIRRAERPVLVVGPTPQGPYRRPLVAVDLSDESVAVARAAVPLIAADVRTVPLVHAWRAHLDPYVARALDVEELRAWKTELRACARAGMDHLVAELAAEGGRFRAVIREGDPRVVLAEEAIGRHTDLVVTGTHARSRLASVFLGSVATSLLRGVPADTLVVHPSGQGLAATPQTAST